MSSDKFSFVRLTSTIIEIWTIFPPASFNFYLHSFFTGIFSNNFNRCTLFPVAIDRILLIKNFEKSRMGILALCRKQIIYVILHSIVQNTCFQFMRLYVICNCIHRTFTRQGFDVSASLWITHFAYLLWVLLILHSCKTRREFHHNISQCFYANINL